MKSLQVAFLLSLLTVAICAAETEETFQLSGQVVLASPTHPKPRAAYVTLRHASQPLAREGWTDARLRFKFDDLQPGTYLLRVEVPRYGSRRISLDVSSAFADQRGRIEQQVTVEPGLLPGAGTVSVGDLSVPKKAKELYAKAQKDLAKGKGESALAKLEEALRLAPGYTSALNLAGTICYQGADFERARKYFEKALEGSDYFAPLVNLGGTLLSLGHYQEALEINREAVKREPDEPLANSQLGLSLMLLNRDDEALVYLEKSRSLEPSHFSYPQLYMAQIHERNGRADEAAELLHEFVRLHPDLPQTNRIKEALRSDQP